MSSFEGGSQVEIPGADAGSRSAARSGAIDLLRGWAALSVMLLHLNIRVPFDGCWLGQSLPKPLYKLIFWSGYQAVMVFFVISGFLITGMSEARWGSLDLGLNVTALTWGTAAVLLAVTANPSSSRRLWQVRQVHFVAVSAQPAQRQGGGAALEAHR